jgi:hypothetical protein
MIIRTSYHIYHRNEMRDIISSSVGSDHFRDIYIFASEPILIVLSVSGWMTAGKKRPEIIKRLESPACTDRFEIRNQSLPIMHPIDQVSA